MIVLTAAHPEDSIFRNQPFPVYRWPVPVSSQCFLSLCPQAAPLLDRVICSGNKTLYRYRYISGFMAMIFRHYYC